MRVAPGFGCAAAERSAQTSCVTDTIDRPLSVPTEWPHRSSVRTYAELLLGLSFTAAVAFGGYSAATGRMAVAAQGAAIVFLVTLTVVVVQWFVAVDLEDVEAR